MSAAVTQRIDSHHHLWHYTRSEFPWLDDEELVSLRRDFLVDEFRQEMQSAQVRGCVAVQARQTHEETEWLLQIAEQNAEVLGVVGWADIAHPDFASALERLREQPRLKGLRHIVQAEAAGFLDRPDFNRGIDQLAKTGLVYDILIKHDQLAEAVRFVDRHPTQSFVLDHIAKPDIRGGSMEPWARNLRELARRQNVTCKLSGMVTEADPRHWTPQQLEPYFQTVLEAFTPHRILAGSDWPVLLAGSTYAGWWQRIEGWVAPLTPCEREAITCGTAISVYHLDAGCL